MQAIFAVRTTDGAGRPARVRLAIVTSHDHGALSALVIIATQISPKGTSLRLEMTSAGRKPWQCEPEDPEQLQSRRREPAPQAVATSICAKDVFDSAEFVRHGGESQLSTRLREAQGDAGALVAGGRSC